MEAVREPYPTARRHGPGGEPHHRCASSKPPAGVKVSNMFSSLTVTDTCECVGYEPKIRLRQRDVKRDKKEQSNTVKPDGFGHVRTVCTDAVGGETVTLEPSESQLGWLEWADEERESFIGQLSKPKGDLSGYTCISGVVDTGAEEHAVTPSTAPWIATTPSAASRAGKCFRGPGGEKIPAQGRRVIIGQTREGRWRKLICEVCPIRRNLFSGARIALAGNRVEVGAKSASIRNLKSGEISHLRREGNVWMLDLWLKTPATDESGFTRQES